jgi:hypothetical protein
LFSIKYNNTAFEPDLLGGRIVRKIIAVSVIAVLFVFSAMALVNAKTYEYKVTSNFHGIDAWPGADVVVTATTDDPGITQVTFLWKDGSENVKYTDVVAIVDGTAESSHQPDSTGDWGVQALFQGPDGKTKEGVDLVVSIKATSFFVIPEIPIFATAGTLLAMLLALGYKMKREQH